MRKYFSDISNERIPESDTTTLKISAGSPLRSVFGAEIHINASECESLARHLGRPLPGSPPDRADNGVDPKPAPRRPKGPKGAA